MKTWNTTEESQEASPSAKPLWPLALLLAIVLVSAIAVDFISETSPVQVPVVVQNK